jgi:M6 family metalloprotease-like protein
MKKFIFLIAILISSCSTSSANFESSASSSTKSGETSQNENTIEEENLVEESILVDITSRDLLANPSFCRIDNIIEDSVRVAFPMSKNRLPSKGNINVQVLFIDFPDQEGIRNQDEINSFFSNYIIGIENFFNFQSDGRTNFTWFIEPYFVRIPQNFSSLKVKRSDSRDLDQILRSAIQISDTTVDYTDIDMVIVFINPDIPTALADVSPAWPLDDPWGIVTNEKTIYNATFIAGDAIIGGYSIIAHEIGHLFGLVDLYNFEWNKILPVKYDNHYIFTGYFDFMSFAFPISNFGDNRDMLGWQRWLLNWITDDEVDCLLADKTSNTTHLLSPVANSNDKQRMIAVRMSETKVLVVEQRSKNNYCNICSGGIYTYLIDSEIKNGYGPIRIIRPEHSKMELYQDAYLEIDQLLMYENITIKVEQKQNDNTVVRIIID